MTVVSDPSKGAGPEHHGGKTLPLSASVVAIVGIVVVAVLVLQVMPLAENGPGPEPQQDPNTWVDLDPASHPPARWDHAMAYDPIAKRVVLFGGQTDARHWLNDTWTYDPVGNTWTNVTPAASPPVWVHQVRLVYDAGLDRVLLFAPSGPGMDLEVWEFNTAAGLWTFRSETCCFFSSRLFAVEYDARLGQTVLFGGGGWAAHFQGIGSDETWLYNSTDDTWVQVNATLSPPRRFDSSLAYDSGAGQVTLFGGCSLPATDFGCTESNDTWAYDAVNETWIALDPVAYPPSLEVIVYDWNSDRLIAFGGVVGYGGNETWAYDRGSNAWTDQRPASPPPSRSGQAMVYAVDVGRVILFGGFGGGNALNDTWSFQPS